MKSIAVASLVSFALAADATVQQPDTISSPWTSTSHEAVLPEPFGTVRIELLIAERGQASDLEFLVGDKVLGVEPALIADLAGASVVGVSYSDPALTDSGSVEYFEVVLIFGASYKIRNEPCDNRYNFTWERDLAIFRVSSDLSISRETVSFRSMDACGADDVD